MSIITKLINPLSKNQAIISVIASRSDAEAETLIKGDEINIEDHKNLAEDDTINIEEIFEDGAIPENIDNEIEDSAEEIETEEINNEIISQANNSEKEEDDSSSKD